MSPYGQKKNMSETTSILANRIIDPVNPMRSSLDRDKLEEIANSIKTHGLINPITVRPVTADGEPYKEWRDKNPNLKIEDSIVQYEIVAGHRRFRACLIAGVIEIPCIIKELTDEQMIEIRAHENLFRVDLDAVEEAVAIGTLISEDETAIPDVARRMGKSVQWVEDRLDILTYPEYFIVPIKLGRVSLGVSKWLSRINDDVYRKMFFDQAVNNGMAVWQAEYYYNQWNAGVFKSSSDILPPPENSAPHEPLRLQAVCARCGSSAVAPNLKSVFIHFDCPEEVVATE